MKGGKRQLKDRMARSNDESIVPNRPPERRLNKRKPPPVSRRGSSIYQSNGWTSDC